MKLSSEAVIIGAGIVGVAACHELVVNRGVSRVAIVDPRPPLTLTSEKSTECFRNFYPSAAMVGLSNRSIELLEGLAEQSGNLFNMAQRGYLFVTAQEDHWQSLRDSAHRSSEVGAGPIRVHPGSAHQDEQPTGFDLYETPEALTARFPYITPLAVGGLYVRRAGWLSAQQLGRWMLSEAQERGAELIVDRVVDIVVRRGSVKGVILESGEEISTPVVVNATGPMSSQVAGYVGIDPPERAEVHHQVTFRDHLGVFPREAPMLIWSDPQRIEWSSEEESALSEAGHDHILQEIPVAPYGRPEGGVDSPYFHALWDYRPIISNAPTFPLPEPDPMFPEVVMRGMAKMLPGLARYRQGLPASFVDGGYVMKTPENLPLIGPAGPDGFHLITAMSGFGVMMCAGAAELAADHILGEHLPDYASVFLYSRYSDPTYLSEQNLTFTGELAKSTSRR